jgi:NADH-quinone oxidoreductase subunit C
VNSLSVADIVDRVKRAHPAVEAKTSDNNQPWLLVPTTDLLAVATLLRDDADLRFDSLMDLSGWDLLKYPATPPCSDIAVAYYLHSLTHRHHLTLKVLCPRDAAQVPSVSGVWAVANYFEREVYDLLGVTFTGHPNLKRIMNPDDWIDHPLRKDYVYPTAYNGITHLRDGQKFEAAPPRAVVASPEPARGAGA